MFSTFTPFDYSVWVIVKHHDFPLKLKIFMSHFKELLMLSIALKGRKKMYTSQH
jgi:hypothetical protein